MPLETIEEEAGPSTSPRSPSSPDLQQQDSQKETYVDPGLHPVPIDPAAVDATARPASTAYYYPLLPAGSSGAEQERSPADRRECKERTCGLRRSTLVLLVLLVIVFIGAGVGGGVLGGNAVTNA
jgi:hypothetical protein